MARRGSSGVEPRRIGRWRIDGQLGAGGMGRVFLGRAGDERVAIKVVHAGLAADPQFRARFRREVAVSRRVQGRFGASVVDADTEAPEPWLAITYVPGPTLAQRVADAGPRPAEEVITVGAALASALHDVHGVGVHHRDLKPANVILGASGPVVIDFGIAAAADATSLTATGSVLGSAGWMAPEQIRGEETGAAADVFAWGATVAFAATGRSPFGTGRADAVAYRVAHEEPDLAGVPDEVADLVEQALAKQPADRPTVDTLLAALALVVAGTGTVVQGGSVDDAVTTLWAPPPADGPPTPARSRRRRWSVAVAAIVIAGVVAPGAFILAQDDDPADRVAADAPTTSTPVDSTTATAQPAAAVAPSTTSTTTPPLSTTTTSPPTTTTAPAAPALEASYVPASATDGTAFIDFVNANLQEVVRLDVSWSDDGVGSVDVDPEWEPGRGLVFVTGACFDADICGGMEILVNDLGSVPDANLYYDSGFWVLSGRFAVQAVILSNGGVTSVSLRAVPVA